ncbi:MAG: heavy-metal-associated domain-containing protein [Pirellula sp.]|jgi:copper chaperone
MTNRSTQHIFSVTGMTCGHCKSAVEEAIRQVPDVINVKVDLSAGTAIVSGTPIAQQVVEAVKEAGYVASLKG